MGAIEIAPVGQSRSSTGVDEMFRLTMWTRGFARAGILLLPFDLEALVLFPVVAHKCGEVAGLVLDDDAQGYFFGVVFLGGLQFFKDFAGQQLARLYRQ